METKLKFNQTLFVVPSDRETCLCYNKYGDFQILEWDQEEYAFYDTELDVFYSAYDCSLWAYLPQKECKEFESKVTTKVTK